MASGAQLSLVESRPSNRWAVDRCFAAEHRQRGDIQLDVGTISTNGFMTTSDTGLSRGERIVIRLPHIGRIEAHLSWSLGERAGFQFERIIRPEDFALMIAGVEADGERARVADRK